MTNAHSTSLMPACSERRLCMYEMTQFGVCEAQPGIQLPKLEACAHLRKNSFIDPPSTPQNLEHYYCMIYIVYVTNTPPLQVSYSSDLWEVRLRRAAWFNIQSRRPYPNSEIQICHLRRCHSLLWSTDNDNLEAGYKQRKSTQAFQILHMPVPRTLELIYYVWCWKCRAFPQQGRGSMVTTQTSLRFSSTSYSLHITSIHHLSPPDIILSWVPIFRQTTSATSHRSCVKIPSLSLSDVQADTRQ